MKSKNFLFATAVLIGTIVGAGIFGIPYVVSKSGIIPGLFYFLILGGVMILVHLFFGEIILRTKEKHRLPGLAQKYIGKWGEILIAISTILGTIGVLLIYIIIGGDFLQILFSPWLPLESFYFSLFFWAILVWFIFRGIKLIAPFEILTNSIFFLIIFIIFFFALPKINFQNFTPVDLSNIFLPFGVILFSLMGITAIPEAEEILKTPEERRNYKKVIISSFLIVILLYLFFIFIVTGTSGQNTSPEALQGLIPFLGLEVILFIALAAVITLADSFLVIGLYLRNVLIYDYKLSKMLAALITCTIPLFLFLIGFRSFIETLGLVGIIVGVIQGIIIILIFKKAKSLGDREPEYSLKIPSILLYFLIAILILGAISQIYAW